MPITPDEAAQANLAQLKADLDKTFKRIDEKLTAAYIGDNVVTMWLPYLHDRVRQEIIKTYREKGWEVTIKSHTQRNETEYCAKFSRKIIKPGWARLRAGTVRRKRLV